MHAVRSLERLSDLRGNTAGASDCAVPPGPDRPAWWLFVSTLGELNAISPLLDVLRQRLASLPLVLVTDHAHYRDSYLARCPEAEVFVTRGHSRDAHALAARRPPRLVVVAEIPLLPSDAPCRCSALFLLHARACGATLLAVNGWLYGYPPPSRMDGIERRWLTRPLLAQFDALCVQTPAVRDALLAAGAPATRVHVTGNLKFDALQAESTWRIASARSPTLLQSIVASARAVVVAGSMTRDDEQRLVFEAFVGLRRSRPDALLVLAPRHPEIQANLDAIAAASERWQLKVAWRSRVGDQALDAGSDVLVLDTMGELRDFYAVASVAHVGVDHNVLEPLGYGKPTSVLPGWEPTYPSYAVYSSLRDAEALLHADGAMALQARWAEALDGRAAGALARAQQLLLGTGTSLQRHLAVLGGVMPAAS